MATLEKTISKAIEIATPEVLKESRLFFRLMEDLSPELVRERLELEWMYSDEIGKLLFSVYESKHGMLESAMLDSARKEIKNILEQNRGLKEEKQEWFVQVFSRAFSTSDLDFSIEVGSDEVSYQETERSCTDCLSEDEKSYVYYLKEADSGNPEAAYMVGYMSEYGKGTSIDTERAFTYYKKAADSGNPEAAYTVGYMSAFGKGTSIDTERAFTYYKKAALAGDLFAIREVGVFYYFGLHGQKDLERAYLCFDFAAQKGEDLSMYMLGDMYEMGEYVEKNLETALYWYEKAFRYGYQSAEEACQRLGKTISG